jgi:hypothetical protein
MIWRWATAAGIQAPVGNYTFRATRTTGWLSNGGALAVRALKSSLISPPHSAANAQGGSEEVGG